MITPTLDHERDLAEQGHDLIIGFDEVGRGALAGPAMVGCAAVWSRDLRGLTVPAGVADSKLLTARRREAIFDELALWPAVWAIGETSNTEIDDWGITHALGIAALRALGKAEKALGLKPPSAGSAGRPVRVGAILDGPSDYITPAMNTFDAPDVPVPAQVTTLVKGDRQCATVAAAAILAKVTRDRLMVDIAKSNPRYAPYGWADNKGYGTRAHREAIAKLGPTSLHRLSWHLA